MSVDITTNAAAERLGTSKPTVRSLIERGELRANRQPRGTRFRWMIAEASVAEFLDSHGRFDERDHARRLNLASVDARLRALESAVGTSTVDSDTSSAVRELDAARARVVDLEEALVRSRAAAELQLQADGARAEIIQHLQAALAASERADELRRRVARELDEGLSSFTRLGHLGSLGGG